MNERKCSVLTRWIVGLVFVLAAFNGAAMQRFSGKPTAGAVQLFNRAQDFLEIKHQTDSAMNCLAALTALYESGQISKNDTVDMTIVYNTLGALYASQYGNYAEASSNLLKGLDEARLRGDKIMEPRIRYNLAAMQYEQGLLTCKPGIVDSTLNRFLGILKNLRNPEDKNLILPLALSAAEISLREHSSDKEIALSGILALQDSADKEFAILGRLMEAHQRGNYEGALALSDYLHNSLLHSLHPMADQWAPVTNVLRAHLLLDSDREAEAMQLYGALLSGEDSSTSLFEKYELLHHLREYNLRKGKSAVAKEFELDELRTKDSLISRSGALSLEGSQALFDQEKLRGAIALEGARVRAFRMMFWITLGFVVLLGILLVLLYVKFKEVANSRKIILRNDKEHFALERTEDDKVNIKAPSENPDSRQQEDFLKLQEIISGNQEIYDENFSTSRMAELAGMRSSEMASVIMDATGETTLQFLSRIRIREACRRMNDRANYGDYTIEAIGQSVGYRSRSHFGSIFKKIVGMTPSQYASGIH